MHRDVHVTGGKDYTVDTVVHPKHGECYAVRSGVDTFYFSSDREWLETVTERKGFVPVAWEARMVLDAVLPSGSSDPQ